MNIAKILRAVIGLIVVFAIAMVAYNMYSDYRSAPRPASSGTTTASAPASVVTSGTAMVGTARIDGVNFRVNPASNAKLIRGLKKGEKFTIIAKDGQWYKVKDSKGTLGWVTANTDYVAVQPK